MSSARLPGKVMAPVRGQPLIGYLLQRLSLSRHLDQIVVATSTAPENDSLHDFVARLGYLVFRGSENDVLDRYYQAAQWVNASVIVRITGDCPLIDPSLVDIVIDKLLECGVDYTENAAIPTYPNGLEAEAFTFATLRETWSSATLEYQREHVTPYVRQSGRFSLINCPASEDYSTHRWTVDEPEDLMVVTKIIEYFYPVTNFGWREILELHNRHPDWFSANHHIPRNEGAILSTEEKKRRRLS